jgi:hypothetical protein
MINNPTNVNKTNNHLSPDIIGNPDPGLGHTQNCGGKITILRQKINFFQILGTAPPPLPWIRP